MLSLVFPIVVRVVDTAGNVIQGVTINAFSGDQAVGQGVTNDQGIAEIALEILKVATCMGGGTEVPTSPRVSPLIRIRSTRTFLTGAKRRKRILLLQRIHP